MNRKQSTNHPAGGAAGLNMTCTAPMYPDSSHPLVSLRNIARFLILSAGNGNHLVIFIWGGNIKKNYDFKISPEFSHYAKE